MHRPGHSATSIRTPWRSWPRTRRFASHIAAGSGLKASTPRNTGGFFGYIDECQYLNGVVAGHMSKSKKLGFIAAKPIPQVLRNIDAFTMGARSTDPNYHHRDLHRRLVHAGQGSRGHQQPRRSGRGRVHDAGDGPKVIVETAAKRGKMVCGYHASQAKLAPNAYLTGAEWNWLTADKTIIDAAHSGKPHPNFVRGGLT